MQQEGLAFNISRDLFRPGEPVYINKAFEQPESHLHAHDFIEIAYVASGRGIHHIDGREYSVSKGDLFVINTHVPHEFRSYPDQPRLTVYNCIFTPEFIDVSLMDCEDFSNVANHFLFRSFFPEEVENPADIKLLDIDSRELEVLYEKMHREYYSQEKGYVQMLRSYVIELLITVFRLYGRSSSPESGINRRRSQIIEDVIRYMKSNYAHEFKLEDLSLMAFLSRSYFCRLFKDTTGMTVFEYAQKIRMEEACRLLRETDRKIVDIAADVGYNDIKFFNTVFKRIMGKTPGQYRKTD